MFFANFIAFKIIIFFSDKQIKANNYLSFENTVESFDYCFNRVNDIFTTLDIFESNARNGTNSMGSGKIVTLYVSDSDNNLVYMNEGVSSEEGSFEFIFNLPSKAENEVYTVFIGGKEIQKPITLKFTKI